MVELKALLDDSRVMLDVPADCPKAVFREGAERLSQVADVCAKDVVSALNERERMGSTAVGGGVAIPHARLKTISGPQAALMRLVQPIDMDAPDDAPVDILFVLLVPDEADSDHLRVLSRISRIIRQPENLMQIRRAQRSAEIIPLFQED